MALVRDRKSAMCRRGPEEGNGDNGEGLGGLLLLAAEVNGDGKLEDKRLMLLVLLEVEGLAVGKGEVAVIPATIVSHRNKINNST